MIPFVDLKGQYAQIKPELDAAVGEVLGSGRYASGKQVAAFEDEFSGYCGSRYGVAVNSGTSALQLAMLACGIGPGDEVITVPFTFVATVAAICYTGARPVLVDIEPRSLTMNIEQLESVITKRTKAIIPVHLYGQSADMDPIMEIARRYNLTVIEDAAQAHGAEYKGRRTGSLGHLGCFSFYPSKNLGACGEGGIVLTDNREYANRLRCFRDWGQDERYHHVLRGYNARMDELQGTILRVKLRHLDEWSEARRAHAALYDKLLADRCVQIPEVLPYARHVYHVYAIQSTQRDVLQQIFQEKGVQTGIHYPIPVHLQPAYVDLGYVSGIFPYAEEAARNVLSLPMYPELKQEQIEEVSSTLPLG
jgi:dTDP-4-amino-4,6-dideoxygalactose transaminase